MACGFWTKQTKSILWSFFLQKHMRASFLGFSKPFIDISNQSDSGEAIATLRLKYDGGVRTRSVNYRSNSAFN